jgi:hypothetical protein
MRWWAASVLLVFAAPGVAATFIATSVEETARSSDAVVRGRVLSTAARLTRDGRSVVTEVEIAVESAWKGAPEATVRLVVPGGSVGRIAQIVDAAARFEEGEEVVVFLARRGAGWRVMGQALGKYRVEGADARPSLSDEDVLPRALAAGERAVGPMAVAELERRVRAAR